MAVRKLSQIASAPGSPALTDTVVGVGGGTTDYQYTLSQIRSTASLGQINYQQPTTNANITLNNSDAELILDPATPLGSMTVTMCAAPVDGQRVTIRATQFLYFVTFQGNAGQSVVGVPIAIPAGGAVNAVYRASVTTWYFYEAAPSRIILTQDLNWYLSPTGSDANGDGTSTNPWQTPAAVLFLLLGGGANPNNLPTSSGVSPGIDFNGYIINVNLADGTYNFPFGNAFVLTGLVGGGMLRIRSTSGIAANVIINGPGSATGAALNVLFGTTPTPVVQFQNMTVQNMHNVVVAQGYGQVFATNINCANCGNCYETLGMGAYIAVGGTEVITGSYNSHIFPRDGGEVAWNTTSTTFSGAVAYGKAFCRMVDLDSKAYIVPPGTQVGWAGVTGVKIGAFGGMVEYFGGDDGLVGCPGNGTPVLTGGAYIISSQVAAPPTDGPFFKFGQTDYTYYTPTTGSTINFGNQDRIAIIDPAAGLAALTVKMVGNAMDGQTVQFRTSKAITALTVSPNTGQTIVGSPTTMAAGDRADAVFKASNSTWYF